MKFLLVVSLAFVLVISSSAVFAAEELVKVKLKVEGMSWTTCESVVRRVLMKVPGVKSAMADYQNGEALVEYDPKLTNLEVLAEAVTQKGYKAVPVTELGSETNK